MASHQQYPPQQQYQVYQQQYTPQQIAPEGQAPQAQPSYLEQAKQPDQYTGQSVAQSQYPPPTPPALQQYGSQQQVLQQPAPQPQQLVQLTPEEAQQFQLLQKYQSILHLPIFPFMGSDDGAAARESEKMRAELQAAIVPRPQLSGTDKVMLHAMSAFTGATFFSMDGMVNGLAKGGIAISAAMDAISASRPVLVLYSRWSSQPGAGCARIVVDTMEVRQAKKPQARAMVYVKVSRKAKVNVGGVDKTKKIKPKEKHAYLTTPEGAMKELFVVDGDKKAPTRYKLEKVLEMNRVMNPMDHSQTVLTRWYKWRLPEV